MFHICLHPDLDAFSGGLANATGWNATTGEEKTGSAVSIARRRVGALSLLGCGEGGAAKLEKLAARAAPRPSMPSSCLPSSGLYACMYLSGHCSIYITIRPSGLCTNTKSLRSHALQRRFSGQCRLTVLGTFAFMFLFALLLSPSLSNISFISRHGKRLKALTKWL